MILRLLALFPQGREILQRFRLENERVQSHERMLAEARLDNEKLALKLRDTEHALFVMTEARLNVDRSLEFLRGEVEALKEAHSREVDGLKRTIDAFAPSAIGRTVFGLAPEPKPLAEEPPMVGARTRRTTQAEALAHFYAEAEKRVQAAQGLHPNPNGDAAADFTVKQ